jgi:hypothetical protein
MKIYNKELKIKKNKEKRVFGSVYNPERSPVRRPAVV